MKNKSVTYLLIGVVLLIWGLVFYRLFNASHDEEVFVPMGKTYSSKKEVSLEADTFELIIDYRDPFLGKVHANHVSENQPTRSIVKPKVAEPKIVASPIDWSFISYKGAITNKFSKKEVGIFRINNVDAMMSANERTGEITILKVSRDSAQILYRGVKKSFFKEF